MCTTVKERPLDRGLMTVTRGVGGLAACLQPLSAPAFYFPTPCTQWSTQKQKAEAEEPLEVRGRYRQMKNSPLSPRLSAGASAPSSQVISERLHFLILKNCTHDLGALTTVAPAGTLPSSSLPSKALPFPPPPKKDLRGICQAGESSVCLSVCLPWSVCP